MDHVQNRQAGIEKKAEELDHSVKVHNELKIHEQNVGEFGNIIKRPSLQILGVEKKYYSKSIESIFSKILEEHFLNLEKNMIIQIYRTPNKQDKKRNSP